MNTKDEILAFVRDTEPVPMIDIINQVSYKYSPMINSLVTNMMNRNILFVDDNNCITTERYIDVEKQAVIYLLSNDRESKEYLLRNCSNKICRIVKKFIHNDYLINVSRNNWTINPEKWKEIFHGIYGFDIEKSKILGNRLSKYKTIFKYGEIIFSD